MPTPSQTDANKSETFATLEATYPNLNGTGPSALLEGVKEEMDTFTTGLRGMSGTIKLRQNKRLFELSISVDPQPAPISPPSTRRDVLDVRSPDASLPPYNWGDIARVVQYLSFVRNLQKIPLYQLSAILENTIGKYQKKRFLREAKGSLSASSGGSPDSSSS